MRTQIFNNYTDLPKEFNEDFKLLWEFPDGQKYSLIPYISQIYKEDTSQGQENLM